MILYFGRLGRRLAPSRHRQNDVRLRLGSSERRPHRRRIQGGSRHGDEWISHVQLIDWKLRPPSCILIYAVVLISASLNIMSVFLRLGLTKGTKPDPDCWEKEGNFKNRLVQIIARSTCLVKSWANLFHLAETRLPLVSNQDLCGHPRKELIRYEFY